MSLSEPGECSPAGEGAQPLGTLKSRQDPFLKPVVWYEVTAAVVTYPEEAWRSYPQGTRFLRDLGGTPGTVPYTPATATLKEITGLRDLPTSAHHPSLEP